MSSIAPYIRVLCLLEHFPKVVEEYDPYIVTVAFLDVVRTVNEWDKIVALVPFALENVKVNSERRIQSLKKTDSVGMWVYENFVKDGGEEF